MNEHMSRLGVRVVDDPKMPDGVRVEFVDAKAHEVFVEKVFAAFADDNKKISAGEPRVTRPKTETCS